MIAARGKVKTCNVNTPGGNLIGGADIAAAFEWWRNAGVDLDFSDDVTDWLAEPVAEEEVRAPATAKTAEVQPVAPKKADLLGPNPPQDLAAFREWWLAAPGLDAIGPRGRIPPRGEAGAKLMILAVDPEEEDREHLFSGPQGRLLSRMLGAMGVAEEETYLATALPRHTPLAGGEALLSAGYGEVLLHHIALARPEKILAFGANILPLLGHNAAQGAKSLREINHEKGSTPLMASEGLDSLLAMPRLKARFWRRWLEWTDD